MSPATRKTYFALWIAACKAKGWDSKSDALRRAEVLECMTLVRGPRVTTSDPAFGSDETTALFCYLEFLAHPDSLDHAARWVDCQKDYHAFNRARQADWHEEKAYGKRGSSKLRKYRFAGQQSAAGEPLEQFDPEQIRKRHLTMASRHQRKQRAARECAAGRDLHAHLPAPSSGENFADPDPEYIPPKNEAF
jgi:hypothetical protein